MFVLDFLRLFNRLLTFLCFFDCIIRLTYMFVLDKISLKKEGTT